MALLIRKYRSATLMEAVVATALVVIVFMVASLVINNLLKSYYLGKTQDVAYRVNQLRYQMCYSKIIVPYKEKYGSWSINAEIERDATTEFLQFEATNEASGKTFRRSFIIYGQD